MMSKLSRMRKAVAAFLLPFLGLPLANWIGGVEAFSWEMFAAAAVTGLISAIGVYRVPNAPPV